MTYTYNELCFLTQKTKTRTLYTSKKMMSDHLVSCLENRCVDETYTPWKYCRRVLLMKTILARSTIVAYFLSYQVSVSPNN